MNGRRPKHKAMNRIVASKPLLPQQGTVLITALLIVAIITGLSVSFSNRFQVTIAQAQNRFALSHIQQCLYSLESGLMWFLRDDKKGDIDSGYQKYDHLDEPWADKQAQSLIQIYMQEECSADSLSFTIEDAQSQFNLNRLGGRPEKYDPSFPFETRYTEEQKRFIRLLQTRKDASESGFVSSIEAEQLTDAVIDWIDGDNNTQGVGGAETDYYLSNETPYRSANQPFVSVEELLLVKGFDEQEQLVQELKPLLTALPVASDGVNPGLNVNTAPAQLIRAINLSASAEPIDLSDADSLISSRPATAEAKAEAERDGRIATKESEGFKSIDEFKGTTDFDSVFADNAEQLNLDGLEVGSDFFILLTDIEINSVQRSSYSLIERTGDKGTYRTRVIRRGNYGPL